VCKLAHEFVRQHPPLRRMSLTVVRNMAKSDIHAAQIKWLLTSAVKDEYHWL
jgi:hypothetical protein